MTTNTELPFFYDNGVYRQMTEQENAQFLESLTPPPPVLSTVEEAKAFKLAEIRNHYQTLVDGLKNDAAPYEVTSWPEQADDYKRWLIDPDAPTPYVDGLAAGRGMVKATLMAKIGVKVTGLSFLQGRQHGLEDDVKDAETIEDVLAIVVA